ncbi:DUF29 family protein [Nostoc sp.]|uniref:DUF29 family protein n=1 Tax=Nostoc sp. TaxID=1180 RepID=UPI003FA56318
MGVPETNPKIPMLSPSLYETDFYAWTQEQVTLLRNEQWSQIDLQNSKRSTSSFRVKSMISF